MTKVHGKRYAYKFDFQGLAAATQPTATDPAYKYQSDLFMTPYHHGTKLTSFMNPHHGIATSSCKFCFEANFQRRNHIHRHTHTYTHPLNVQIFGIVDMYVLHGWHTKHYYAKVYINDWNRIVANSTTMQDFRTNTFALLCKITMRKYEKLNICKYLPTPYEYESFNRIFMAHHLWDILSVYRICSTLHIFAIKCDGSFFLIEFSVVHFFYSFMEYFEKSKPDIDLNILETIPYSVHI